MTVLELTNCYITGHYYIYKRFLLLSPLFINASECKSLHRVPSDLPPQHLLQQSFAIVQRCPFCTIAQSHPPIFVFPRHKSRLASSHLVVSLFPRAFETFRPVKEINKSAKERKKRVRIIMTIDTGTLIYAKKEDVSYLIEHA